MEADDPILVRFRQLSRPVRVVYARPRIFIAVAVGIIAFFLLPGSMRPMTRFLVAWDIFAALYLVLVYIMMLRCEHHHIRRNAILQDDGRFVILGWPRSVRLPASLRSCSSLARRIAARSSLRMRR